MNKGRLGNTIVLIVLLFTIPDIIIHFLFLSVREDVLKTFPMVGEAISEGFNVFFSIVILMILSYGYKKGRPVFYLILGALLFYISQLHDFFDEFFVLTIPSIAFEVFAFPLALIFATIGIYKAQQYEKQLQEDNEKLKNLYMEMSNSDSLTGLYNTRRFYEIVPKEIDKIHHENRTLSLMIFDIDDFKLVNDTYGHLEGDRLISNFGTLMKAEFSEKYHCYRYGGEEFVVILEDVDLDTGYKIADDFRLKFSQMIYRVNGHTYQKTISVGLAELSSDDTMLLLEKADKAMYDAKTSGKNKVCHR